jgi:3-methyladenine DNA glycosylase AlkD
MHPQHAAIRAEMERHGKPYRRDGPPINDSYGGSGRPFFGIDVPTRRSMAKRWAAAHKRADAADVLAVVDSLIDGETHEERTQATLILRYHAQARAAAGPAHVDRWLDHLNGWAEVDSLCQNLFTFQDMLADWPGWKALIERLSADANTNKRRASLVLLTGPVHYTDDRRFSDLAFAVIARLKPETPILITKAVSWLLRALVDRHKDETAAYIDANETTLPKVAVREARMKLKTGTKSGKSRRP